MARIPLDRLGAIICEIAEKNIGCHDQISGISAAVSALPF